MLRTGIPSHWFPRERESRLSFDGIGNAFGLSKERVRAIRNIALVKLRAALKLDPVLWS